MSMHHSRRRSTATPPTRRPSTSIRPPRRADVYPWWVWAATPALVILVVGAMILVR